MNLYIIRHAIAIESGASGYENDSQRSLSEKGRAKMVNIALGLKSLGVNFDLIITSPYVRALDTGHILLKSYKMKKDQLAISENLVPTGQPGQLIDEINEKYPHLENIAIIGHEPNLSNIISELLAGDTLLSIELKKGGVCCLNANNLFHKRRATLEWLMMPKHLIALGNME